MKNFTPFRILGLLVVIMAATFCSQAQMLEQIDMSSTPGSANTYVTGLNRTGYACGYYNEGGADTGFIITDKGSILKVRPNSLPGTFTGVKVESINDYGVAVITATNGGAITIFKAYVDTVWDYVADYVAVTGLTQSSSVAFDINNKNDISGWFQSSTRFLFVKHDSIVPTGNIPFESDRFEDPGPVYYNTMAGGVNDANKVAGFYINGANNIPYVYDNLTEVFNELAIVEKTKLWDINNNGWVAGEYQTGGVWTAFIADASTGNFSNFTSLSSIFATTTPAITSVANAINDNGAVGGSFIHPTTGKWTGFLYFPEITEYRIPSFNFATDTWGLINSGSGSAGVWPSAYWQGIDYMSVDPYANNGTPLLDANLMYTHQITSIPNQLNPKWTNFATEFDANQTGLSADPNVQNAYLTIIKPKMFDVWYNFVMPGGFMGDCYGFTYATLLRHFYDNLFSSWYGMPAGTNISTVQNTNYAAIDLLERMLSKQLDPTNQMISARNISPWSGLYRLKCNFRKNFYSSDPSGFKFTAPSFNGTWHSILPYKIRTPRTLPFEGTLRDTMFVYDSNNPDSTSYFMFPNKAMYPSFVPAYSSNYLVTNYSFGEVGIRFMSTEQYSELNKSTASALDYDTMTTIGLFRFSDYTMKHNGNIAAQYVNGVYEHDSTIASPVYRLTADVAPYRHVVDSADVFDITTTNYTDDAMVWIQYNGPRNMGLSRAAQMTETDHSTQKTGLITYGNPDANTKYLTGFLRENSDDLQEAVNITARNICADQGDSIVTRTPSSYVYTITKINGTSTCTYDLDIYTSYNGEIIEFHSPIELGPNTSHTIDPYYVGINGTQVVVIVDNGNDGTADDTLFLPGFPLGVGKAIDNNGIKIYPNPVQDDLTIDFATAGNYQVTITDVVGKVLMSKPLSVSAGKTTFPMDQYPTGMYLIQVADQKGRVLVKDKIIKQ